MLKITANDIMSDHVVVIYEDTLIRQAAHLMLRDRVSGFPVVNEGVGLVGIITMTDMFMMIDKTARESSQEEFDKNIGQVKDAKVGDFMSRDVCTITQQTTLGEILELMVHRRIHVFPVVEDKKLIGIVSRHDILNAILAFD